MMYNNHGISSYISPKTTLSLFLVVAVVVVVFVAAVVVVDDEGSC